jgi:hypothetical protein
VPEIVQEIGAAAGLAAVVGLAILSALYFSQARDVKRLREWAGRAPERAEQQQGQVVAQPQAPKTGAVQPIPGRVTPAPGSALATAAGARPAAATAAAQSKQTPAQPKEGEKPPEAAPVPKPGVPVPVPAGQSAAAAAGAAAKAAATQGSTAAPAKPGEEAKPKEGVAETAGDGAKAGEAPAKAGDGAAAPPAGKKPGEAAAKPEEEKKPEEAEAADKAEEGKEKEKEKVAAGAPAAKAAEAAPAKPAKSEPAKPADGDAKPGAAPKPGVPATPAGARPAQPAPAARAAGGGATLPPRPAAPRPASRPSPSQTAILPPTAAEPRRRWYRRATLRYSILAIAGVLIIGGATAFALSQLAQEEAPTPKPDRTERFSRDSNGDAKPKKKAPAIVPGNVTVAVLNGTTVPGLAAKVGDRVEGLGFQLGNVTNNSDQSRNESVVLYAPDHQDEAAAVARKLNIGQREPIDAASQALAGDAGVVVIAGSDQT